MAEEVLDLIGLEGIVDIYGKPRATIYSWKQRGRLPPPDWTVSGTDIWLRERFADPENIDSAPRDGLPVLLGTQEVAACLDVQAKTVAMIRGRGRQDVKAPEPYAVISRTPVWLSEPWAEFARLTGRPFLEDRLPQRGG